MTDELEPQSTQSTALDRIDYEALSGAGFENTDTKDLSLPFISLLQKLSKSLEEGHQLYIPGAKAGQFLNTSSREVSSELLIVPLYVTHVFVEWTPRDAGGGFKGMHSVTDPKVIAARAAFDANTDPKKKLSKHLLTPEGNNLVETYYVWALLLDKDGETPLSGVVIPFKSTAIKPYKQGIYTPCYSMKGANGRTPPLFSHRLRVTAVSETRPDGTSYNFRIQPLKGSLKDSQIHETSPLARAAYEAYMSVRSRQDDLAAAQAAKGDDTPADSESSTDEVFS